MKMVHISRLVVVATVVTLFASGPQAVTAAENFDSCPITLGVETFEGHFTPIVQRGTPLPATKRALFSSMFPYQAHIFTRLIATRVGGNTGEQEGESDLKRARAKKVDTEQEGQSYFMGQQLGHIRQQLEKNLKARQQRVMSEQNIIRQAKRKGEPVPGWLANKPVEDIPNEVGKYPSDKTLNFEVIGEIKMSEALIIGRRGHNSHRMEDDRPSEDTDIPEGFYGDKNEAPSYNAEGGLRSESEISGGGDLYEFDVEAFDFSERGHDIVEVVMSVNSSLHLIVELVVHSMELGTKSIVLNVGSDQLEGLYDAWYLRPNALGTIPVATSFIAAGGSVGEVENDFEAAHELMNRLWHTVLALQAADWALHVHHDHYSVDKPCGMTPNMTNIAPATSFERYPARWGDSHGNIPHSLGDKLQRAVLETTSVLQDSSAWRNLAPPELLAHFKKYEEKLDSACGAVFQGTGGKCKGAPMHYHHKLQKRYRRASSSLSQSIRDSDL